MGFPAGTSRERFWPVAGFEHYMLADDTLRYPMVFWLKATFSGRVDKDRLNQAFQKIVRQQPLLRSRLHSRLFGFRFRFKWREEPNTLAHLDAAKKGTPLNSPISGHLGFDLKKEPGIRLIVREDEESSEWFLQLHHAVSDGTGGLRFLEQLFKEYAENPPNKNDSPRDDELSPALARRFARRGRFDLSLWQIVKRLHDDIKTTCVYYAVRPRPLAKRKPGYASALASSQFNLPNTVNYTFSARSTAGLKRTARAWSGTLNDLLLRDLFLTLDKFNKSGINKRTIRLCMPVNLRTPNDDNMPIANIMGMCALDRSGPALDRPHDLMAGITAETRRIKSKRLALGITFIPALLSFVPGLLTVAMRRPGYWKCATTAILSNLGPSFRGHLLPQNESGQVAFNGLVLRRLELLPPVKVDANLAIGVVTYDDKMTLTLNYDKLALSDHDAKTILADYLAQLSDSMMFTADEDLEPVSEVETYSVTTAQAPSKSRDTEILPSLTN